MTEIAGVDTSYATLTPAAAAALRADGIAVFAQCLWTGREQPPPRVTNLRVAAGHGFILMGYVAVTARGGASDVDRARAGVPDDLWSRLVLTPVDVELPGIADASVRAAVERAAALGKRRCVYTSYGHWTGAQRNSTAFTDCLLWNALYDNDPDVDFPRLPYGGWSPAQVVGEQWAKDQLARGLLADRDTFVRELLLGEEDRMYSDAEIDAKVGAVVAQLARLGEKLDDVSRLLALVLPKLADGRNAEVRALLESMRQA